ncbi:DUF4231 domain-containing protein [Lysinibacillus sphaericus]|uniref:DUF4231 domain-containing protein n=1 Tax=Lysinibacillus sphaericus TaxID=1421 RepID=UPI0037F85CA5
MNESTKIDLLFSNLEESISFFERRAKQNKFRAYLIKVISVICAALITFFLGIKEIHTVFFSSLALFLAASLTVLNGIEAFFNHQALWIKDAETLSNLRLLKSDIKFQNT